MMFILNALPGACLPTNGGTLNLIPLTWEEFRDTAESNGAKSAVGHKDTAVLVSALSGLDVPENRISVPEFKKGDKHLLALYRGPRLHEGATSLPEGATLSPFLLAVSFTNS